MTGIKQQARLMEAAYKGDNEMTEPLDDYTKAEFPLDLQWQDFIMVRLFGVIGDRVVGASFTVNSDGTEVVSQVLDWAGNGEWSSGEYPHMNLPMTMTLEKQVAQARREMGEARWAELNREWE